jgi:transposase
LTVSTGLISKLEKHSAAALAEPYHELARSVLEAGAVTIDETGWREDRRKAWLWVAVTALATVFTVSSDRFKPYDWLLAHWRQLCWSHLRRDFQAMIDRGNLSEMIGRRLL